MPSLGAKVPSIGEPRDSSPAMVADGSASEPGILRAGSCPDRSASHSHEAGNHSRKHLERDDGSPRKPGIAPVGRLTSLRQFTRGLSLALCAGGLSAPAQERPVFEAEAALMEIEVRVTDGRRQAVADLSKEDFELLENGQRQQIATFEFVRRLEPTEAEGSPGETPFELGSTEEDASSRLRRSTFIYIATHGRRQDRRLIANAVSDFIDENLAPGVFVSLEGSRFTSRRSELHGVLEEMLGGTGGPGRGTLVDTLAVDLARDAEYDESLDSLVEEANDEFETQQDEIADRAALYRRLRMYEYIDLIRALSIYPGRKIVVLFSTGLPVDEENMDIMKVLEDEATRARVRFFVSDVSRLTASPPGGDAESAATMESFLGDALNNGFDRQAQRRQDNQDGLYELARRTGGRAVLNSNDFGLVFDVVDRETSDYYIIGYYPRNTEQKGRLRRVRVRVNRKGLQVSHQRGYYEERPFEMTSRSERNLRLHQALTFDTPYTDLPIEVDHEFFRDSHGAATLVYSVGMHVGDIPSGSSRKGETLKLTVVAQASARQSGDSGQSPPLIDERRFEMTVPEPALGRLSNDPNSWLHYGSQMSLSPGAYDWKVVVRDDHSGLLGSFHTQVQIPAFRNQLGASSLLLTSRIDDVGSAKRKKSRREQPEDVLEVEGSRFFASSNKKFRRGDAIYALYDVYNADTGSLETPPSSKIALYRGNERVAPLPVTGHQTVPEPQSNRVRYLAALSTSDLSAGDYTIAAMLPTAQGYGPVIYRKFEIVEADVD